MVIKVNPITDATLVAPDPTGPITMGRITHGPTQADGGVEGPQTSAGPSSSNTRPKGVTLVSVQATPPACSSMFCRCSLHRRDERTKS
jgi:hypothetical protein